MTLTVPLCVRLKSGRADRHVTREVRDVHFSITVPGGFATCTVQLDRPLSVNDPLIQQFARLYIYDAATGDIVWEGRQEDPGRGAGPDGQVWTLTATGGAAHAQDIRVPWVYVDRFDLGQAMRSGSSSRAADIGNDISDGEPAYRVGFPRGFVAGVGVEGGFLYQALRETGQTVGRFGYTVDMGVTDASWRAQAATFPSGTVARDNAFNTAGVGASGRVAAADFPATDSYIKYLITRTGTSQTIANDATWAVFEDFYIVGSRFSAGGAAVPSAAYTKATVSDGDVVRDVLGRLLPMFDGAGAGIAADSYEIDHLTYIDDADAAKILEDLMTLVRRFWAAWESDPVTGKYRFEWSPWPTRVRYEATAADGFESPASASEVYNAVKVRYLDRRGRIRWVTRTQHVPALSAAGINRTGTLNLADEAGSAANAAQAGDAWLAERATPRNAGTLTVARPVKDVVSGRMVPPHRIRPGELVRVRDVAPSLDGLNTTDRDGSTVFRIVGTSFAASTAAAVLDLDSTPRRLSTLLAQARREFARARKR